MKKFILGFILGAIIFGSVGVLASQIFARDIYYTPTDDTWKKEDGSNITNVSEALEELYKNYNSIPTTMKLLRDNEGRPPIGNITISEGLSSYKYIIYAAIQSANAEYYFRINPTIISIEELVDEKTKTFNWVGSGTNYTNTINYINNTTLNITQSHGLLDPMIILVK